MNKSVTVRKQITEHSNIVTLQPASSRAASGAACGAAGCPRCTRQPSGSSPYRSWPIGKHNGCCWQRQGTPGDTLRATHQALLLLLLLTTNPPHSLSNSLEFALRLSGRRGNRATLQSHWLHEHIGISSQVRSKFKLYWHHMSTRRPARVWHLSSPPDTMQSGQKISNGLTEKCG